MFIKLQCSDKCSQNLANSKSFRLKPPHKIMKLTSWHMFLWICSSGHLPQWLCGTFAEISKKFIPYLESKRDRKTSKIGYTYNGNKMLYNNSNNSMTKWKRQRVLLKMCLMRYKICDNIGDLSQCTPVHKLKSHFEQITVNGCNWWTCTRCMYSLFIYSVGFGNEQFIISKWFLVKPWAKRTCACVLVCVFVVPYT